MRFTPRPYSLHAALAAVGLTATIGQLVLLRELVAIFYGNELILGLILATWLAWVAVGAWLLGQRFPKAKASKALSNSKSLCSALTAGLVAAAAILPAQVALVRASPTLLGAPPGALVALGPMVLTILISLAPLCLLLGWMFTLGARLLAREGSSIGMSCTSILSFAARAPALRFTMHVGHGVAIMSAPFSIASLTRSAAMLDARSGSSDSSGPPQHIACSRL